ncbi:MAG: hypothetical protein ABIP14_16425 [Blastocatellia bacterium]
MASLALCVALVGFALARFVTQAVANPQLPMELATIEAAASYFPNSARLQARLAAALVENGIAPGESHEELSARAFTHATIAVRLAPANHEYRLLLAAAAELQGNLEEAEAALRESVRLAPKDTNAHWQMANLLLRMGKTEESLGEFHAVTTADPSRLPNVCALIWQATGADLKALDRVVSGEPQARVALALFLVGQSQFDAAAKVFSAVDRNVRLDAAESGRVIDAMLRAQQWGLAGRLWRETVAEPSAEANAEALLFWNGGFEQTPRKGLAQFDWQIGRSNYARVAISSVRARGGKNALRLSYLGIDTTRLDQEIQELVSVRPGASYRLEYFAKTGNLVTPEGPQIAILRPDNRAMIAASATIAPGSSDWQMMRVDFVAPPDAAAVLVTVRQTPRFSYVEPTQGIIWFDDFSLKAK